MLDFWTQRKVSILRGFGYFLIWGDFYLLFFAAHALLVGSMDLETHVRAYLQVFVPLCEWFASLGSVADAYMSFVFGLPAAAAYLGRFTLSTSIGTWLVRWSARQGTAVRKA